MRQRPLRPRLLAAAALMLLAGVWQHAWPAPEPGIAVVMGPGPVTTVNLPTVAAIFRRKRQLWDDGSRIVPVNLPAAHALRRQFSLRLFKRSPEDMQDYWNDQYFHGVLPPAVLASEEAVIRFVASTPGAIGYVSSCTQDKRVIVVALVPGTDASCPH
ncbi:hypothetical protein ACG04R_05995 [Roseateles sp. BYS78W]|uniref:Phosphate ABC transporter substrate-binding protein n=1 Tax=Pelomonas candidula TaxID=3299025 RepID=A0ABW7H8I5_9BURK